MRILTILGSPRRHGNTAAVLDMFEQCVPPAHQVERLLVTDYDGHGCLGCGTCQRNLDEPGCRQRDDALAIFRRMLAADVVVYATPLYAWSFPAQLKALLDRHYCLTKWGDDGVIKSFQDGQRTALLVTCGDAAENNADLILVQFERMMEAGRCRVVGKYVVPHCSEPEMLGDAARAAAAALARDIGV
jgi:multimeric flavodoxin WrbA